MKAWLFALFWLLLLAARPQVASAESSVVLLGLRSLDGDDDQARDVSAALRGAARSVPGFRVSDRDVSLAQMMLAHACEEPDSGCMADIASTLRVDRLIYGTMARNDGGVEIALFVYDAVTGKVEGSHRQTVTAEQLSAGAVTDTAQALMDRLTGRQATGALRVLCDSPGAQVSVDGVAAGNTDDRGELVLAEVVPGKHKITVRDASNGRSKDVPVMVGENATATVRVHVVPVPEPATVAEASVEQDWKPQSQPGQSRDLRRIMGWTSVGVAVALAGATIYSWVRLGNINGDPNMRAYRNDFPPPGQPGGVSDVCKEAKDGTLGMSNSGKAALEANVRSLCQESNALEVLQYVFLGSALAFGGVGTYLLLTDKPKSKTTLSLAPRVGYGVAGLRATVQF